MIKQIINVNNKWKVIVYYNVNYNLFRYIYITFRNAGISKRTIKNIYKNMSSNKAKAVTVSNIDKKISVVLFNNHTNKYDYINSIVHEAEHVKQAMLEGYNIDDSGESPAYTIGYLVMKMLEFFTLL